MTARAIGPRVIEIEFDSAPMTQESVEQKLAPDYVFVRVFGQVNPQYRWGVHVPVPPLGTRTGHEIVTDVCNRLGLPKLTFMHWVDTAEKR